MSNTTERTSTSSWGMLRAASSSARRRSSTRMREWSRAMVMAGLESLSGAGAEPALLTPVFLHFGRQFDTQWADAHDLQLYVAVAATDDLARERAACEADGAGALGAFGAQGGRGGRNR